MSRQGSNGPVSPIAVTFWRIGLAAFALFTLFVLIPLAEWK